MTPEEIKKLSEECALHYQGRPANEGYELSNRLTIESYALMTLKWLLKDYAIVPKSKVRGEYTDAVAEGNHAHVKHQIQSRTRLRTLESIFGKDMFEE